MTAKTAYSLITMLCSAAALATGGCATLEAFDAQWGYRRIELGQPPGQYVDKLPAECSRRTALGLCSFCQHAGRTRAVVVLVRGDRRVAAKLLAELDKRGKYQLVGELDPNLLDTAGAGPLDTLRLLVAELTGYRGERLAVEAHAVAAAGLRRMLERWPQAAPAGSESSLLDAWLRRVPPNGEVRLELTSAGIFRLAYVADPAR